MHKLLSFGLLYVTACGSDNVIDKQENKAPTILIVSHSDGAEVQDGYVERFRATVSDDDNEFGELSIAWYVGEELVCDWETATPAGESVCEIVFEDGDTKVIAEVRDPQGSGGRSEISVSVAPTEAPIVEMLTPIAGENYYSDGLIQFSALVSDAEDEAEELIVTWTSSVDGELSLDNSINASGEISDYTYLTEGNHAIELRVEDSTGKFSTEEVVIQVGGENSIPTCGFTAPNNGDAFVVGESVIFSGTAMDDDIPSNDLLVEVSSNLDGVFQNLSPFSDGTFSFATNTLSTGTHTITLTVTDEVGADCSTGMLISIGNAPLANIDEPLDGTIYAVGETVTFRGTVSDSEDQANQIAVVWNSDIEGELQSGNANSQGVSQFTRSNLSAGVHSISFSATDTTGLVSDDLISFRVNTLPVVDSLTLSPDPAYSNDNLSVSASTSDADGQNVTASYAWYEDGTLTSFTGTTINASEVQVGETWTVRVTPNDGFQDGNYLEQSVTISNTDPTITTATISPNSNINASSLLTCSASGSDIDDGTLTPIYTWTSSGGATNTGATWQLSPSMVSGSETITCTATVTDNNNATVSSSASVTVDNTPPTSTGIAISPNSGVVTGTALTCSAGFNDLEDGALTPTYAWTVGGNNVSNAATYTVNANDTNVGDSVVCTASVTDSDGNTVTDSATVTVDNTNPTISNVSVSPNIAVTNDATLTCTASASDIDETVSPTFAWNQNGTPFANGATVDLSQHSINPNDTIECVASVADSNGGIASGTDSVGIGNRAPVVTTPTISNTSPEADETITCSATASDADGGTPTLTYVWMNGQTQLGTSATLTLSPSTVNVGDPIVCMVTATDSYGMTGGSSNLATVINTDPTISASTITPSTANVNDLLTCMATGNDLNDGTLTATYTWSASGGATNTGATWQLDSNTVSGAETITCTATVTDNDQATATSSVSITLDNSVPTVDAISITPNTNVVTGTSLTCAATISDTEDGALTPTYAWTVGGNNVSNAATYTVNSTDTNVGDSVVCTVSATDADGNTVSGNSSVTIGNTAPQLDAQPSIDNLSPEIGDTVTCSATATDIDGDTPQLSYEWLDSGNNVLSTASTYTVQGLSVGESLLCRVSFTDGVDSGNTQSSVPATVANTAPTITTATITPNTGLTTSSLLTCSASATDLNDGALTPTYTWSASNGASSTGATWQLDAGTVSPSDSITCTATATDGDGVVVSSTSNSVSLNNSAPSISNVTISPSSSVVTDSTLTCSATASDPDDGTLTPTYAWTVNGSTVSIASTYTVGAGDTDVGDSVVCTATATDGDGQSTSDTASVTVENTEPIINNVTITGNEAGLYNTSSYLCAATVDDIDQNATVTYTWSSGGVELDSGDTLDAATQPLLPMDDLTCSADVVDGDDGSTVSQTGSITLENRTPSAPTVVVTWSGSGNAPTDADDLTCTASGSTDPDGQSLTYTYAWTSDAGGTSSSSTVSASLTSGSETWTCTAFANDTMINSAVGTDSVTIASSCGLTNCDTNLDLGGGQSIDMVLIPSGSDPQGRYTISSEFYLMTTEVTQGMFNQIMGYQSYSGQSSSYGAGNDYPAYFANWHMAADFANKVTQRHNSVNGTSLQQCYSCSSSGTTSVSCTEAVNPYQCSGYVLPTEAEWEYAARSGTTSEFWTGQGSALGGTYSANTITGNETIVDGVSNPLLRDYAWYAGNRNNAYGGEGSKEVGQKLPNGFGLYDMHGNLWEWIADWDGCSFPQTSTDPYCGSVGLYRVARGGRWSHPPDSLRASIRSSYGPAGRSGVIGFRLGLHP